jgi:hypothetical protein
MTADIHIGAGGTFRHQLLDHRARRTVLRHERQQFVNATDRICEQLARRSDHDDMRRSPRRGEPGLVYRPRR